MPQQAGPPIEVPLRSWSELARFFSRDLSGTTLFVPMAALPEVGSALPLVAIAPDGTRLELATRVESQRPAAAGQRSGVVLRFGPLSAAQRATSERWLSRAGAEPSHPQAASARHARPETERRRVASRSTRGPSAAEASARLSAMHEQLRVADPFQALGLPSDAGVAEVEQRHAALVASLHPHHFARYGSPEIKRFATRVFVLVQRHYREARELARARDPRYDPGATAINVHAGPVQRAISESLKALSLFQFDDARRLLEGALAREPDNSQLLAALCVVEGRRERAADHVEGAIAAYREALAHQPGHAEATRALEELEIKRAQKGGLLRRLLLGSGR